MEFGKPLIFLSLILSLSYAAVSEARDTALLGGWRPIKDLSDPHVVEIGKYAVSEYDRRTKADLRFERVVGGESQVVAGMNYKLIIAAKDGEAGSSRNYEAVVWEQEWQHLRNLTSFKPVNGKV